VEIERGLPLRVDLYTDGACRGNPGIGGWGVLLEYEGLKREIFGYEYHTTNNRMELMAAIQGIQAVDGSCEHISVYTDSQYVCKGITEWLDNWKSKGWKTASGKSVKNHDLWTNLDGVCSKHRIDWHWVRGHSGNVGNERADALANLAIDKLTKSDEICGHS